MFVWPGIYLGWEILDKGFEQSAINHGLSSISAVLKNNGYDCFLMDLRAFTGWEHFESILKNQDFDVVIVGFHSVDTKYADQAIRIIKKNFPDKPVIVGGVHLTYNQIERFSLADCVVWGEGEQVVLQLLERMKDKKSIPSYICAGNIENLDILPFVDRNLFNIEYEKKNPILPLLPAPFYTVNFSRGCPFSCTFCLESKNLLWKGYRMRSPENCIDEIKIFSEIGSLMIHDDHFPARNWTIRFIDLWTESLSRIPFWCQIRADWICQNEDLISQLVSIGLTWVSLGIEGSQRMLDFYNKKLKVEQVIKAAEILHKNSVNIFGNYILGAPTETVEDIDELEEILKKVRPEWHSASIYTSYPGSTLFDYIKENNLWVEPEGDPNSHYSLTRFPYERKIRNVNYDFIRQKQAEFSQYKEPLKTYV